MSKKILFTALVLFGLLLCPMAEKCLADAASEFERAESHRINEAYQQAEEIYKTITADYPGTSYALKAQRGLVIVYILTQRSFDAQDALDKLTADFAGYSEPNAVAEALFDIARQYEWSAKYEEAKSVFEQITQQHPNSWYVNRTDLAVPRMNIMGLIASGKDNQARAEIDKLTVEFSKHPDLPSALYSFAKRFKRSHKYEEAKGVYLQLVQRYPDSSYAADVPLNIPRINIISLIRSGRDADAQTAINKLIADFSGQPGLPEALYNIAKNYEWLHKYQKAKSIYQQTTQQCPDSPYAGEAQLSAAKINILQLIESGKGDQAQAEIDKLTADFSGYSNLPQALYHIAERYEGSYQYEEAKSIYLQLVQKYPGSLYAGRVPLEIPRTNILSLIELGRDSEAEAAIDKLIADFAGQPALPAALYSIARKYDRLRKYEEAKNIYQQILQQYPYSDQADRARLSVAKMDVLLLVSSGKDAEAETALDSLIVDFKSHRELPTAVFMIGEEYYYKAMDNKKNGHNDQARECFIKAIIVWERIITQLPPSLPDTAHAYYFSARCYERLGEYENAIQYYEKILSTWPNYNDAGYAQFSIGKSYESLRDSGSLPEAEANRLIEAAYRAVVEDCPDCGRAKDACLKLGWLNFKRGQWTDAAGYWEAALERYPENYRPSRILYALGRAYEEMGQFDKAEGVYNKFINTAAPDDPQIGKVKARLEKLGITSDN